MAQIYIFLTHSISCPPKKHSAETEKFSAKKQCLQCRNYNGAIISAEKATLITPFGIGKFITKTPNELPQKHRMIYHENTE